MAAEFVEHGVERSLPGLRTYACYDPASGRPDADRKLGRCDICAGHVLNQGLHLIGNDDMALLIGVLFSFVTLGKMRGFRARRFNGSATSASRQRPQSHFWWVQAEVLAEFFRIAASPRQLFLSPCMSHVSLLLLAWLLAALMRLATGSATVAMTTAAGIVAPIAPMRRRASRAAGHCDGRRFADLFARERWWILAREGILQYDRDANPQDMVGLRNHHFSFGARLHSASIACGLTSGQHLRRVILILTRLVSSKGP